MRIRFLTLSILAILAIGFVSYNITHALFSDAAQSSDNTFTAADIFPGSPGSVVINEINWGGSNGDGNDEWIELRNMTSNPININNWIVENLGTGGPGANISIATTSATLPANGFYLISAKIKENSKINVDPDFVKSSVSLSNGGEQLRLIASPSGIVIDSANATSSAWFFGSNATPKKSMERKDPPGDGTVSTNWQTATTHTNMDSATSSAEFGTPKAVNGL